MKRNLSLLLLIALLLPMTFGMFETGIAYGESLYNVEDIVEETGYYMLKNKEAFTDAWPIIGLARYGKIDIKDITENYLKDLSKELSDNKGKLSTSKYTEYSKAILVLTSLGVNPQDIGGYNLLNYLSDIDNLTIQGINGPTFALIAIDSNTYQSPIPKENLIKYILDNEKEGGGWALSSNKADADITGMVITSLAKYKERKDVKPYIERALSFLSNSQNQVGGFETMGAENAESSAQVLLALSSLGIDPTRDARFIKNGNTIIDNLINNFRNKDGGFSHIKGTKTDKIATEQVFYSLVSYLRYKNVNKALFDMTDINIEKVSNEVNSNMGDNPFMDIDTDPEKEAIVSLNKAGIIEGVSQIEFKPNQNIKRSEFAALITRALKLKESKDHGFLDVKESDWFSSYVGGAKKSQLINGYPDNTFRPNNNISRQEAGVIIYNMAKYKGIDTRMSDLEIRNYLSQFPDYMEIKDWSKVQLAFGVKKAYIPNSIVYIEASRDATRSEVAGMLYRLLD